MSPNTTCSECGGRMRRGFIVETEGNGSPYDASYWLEGEPVKSSWSGHLKTEDKQAFYATAYRCENCGLLKFYATQNVTDK